MARVLGIDYGEKRVGLAIGSTDEGIALPFRVITYAREEGLFKELQLVIKAERIERIVVGLPLTLQGAKGGQAERVEHFVARLKSNVQSTDNRGLDFAFIDERMTTGRAGANDAQAAALIAQAYLDREHRT